jgi:hypothetical protein
MKTRGKDRWSKEPQEQDYLAAKSYLSLICDEHTAARRTKKLRSASQGADGGFASMSGHMAHYAWAGTGAVVQVHGEGPFQITYMKAADDPRNARK